MRTMPTVHVVAVATVALVVVVYSRNFVQPLETRRTVKDAPSSESTSEAHVSGTDEMAGMLLSSSWLSNLNSSSNDELTISEMRS